MVSGNGRTITWYSFNQPERLTRSGNTVHLWYGPHRERIRREDVIDGKKRTTYYVGGVEYITQANQTQWIRRRVAGQVLINIKLKNKADGAQVINTLTHVLLTDHLGSTHRVVDPLGQTIYAAHRFDPWGQRRSDGAAPLSMPFSSSFAKYTTRGFSGHEMLDPVGLVHMNGRLYAPEIGRFISADPFVQAPKNLQSYNRYTYVLNNPLSYTDPSGFFFKRLFKKFFKKIFYRLKSAFKSFIKSALGNLAVAAASFLCGPCGRLAQIGLNIKRDGRLGRVIRAVRHGDRKSIIGSLLRSYMPVYRASYNTVINSYPESGSTQPILEVIQRIVTSAIIEGTVSALSGGKFANGAATGALYAVVEEVAPNDQNSPNKYEYISGTNINWGV